VTVLSVTDHDTVAGCQEARASCEPAGIEFVPGIEVTAVLEGLDVHVLGYFIDITSARLHASLAEQRQLRIDRFRSIVDRLASLGIPLDAEAVLQPALTDRSRSVGRPWIARALVAAGHAKDTQDAFDRWLASGRPAFVPRVGAPPENAFDWIHDAGGIASLAHPGLLRRDEWIPRFADAGLDALEVYHSKHDAAATERYRQLARTVGLAVSGGSDYHADDAHGPAALGSTALPHEEFVALKARRTRRAPPC
jgi:predicted metal-dependent phosphoesterase TrpH